MEIRRVAVLGGGVMGSGIAAHLANAGIDSLLYDLVPAGVPADAPPAKRSALALAGIETAVKARPAAFFTPGDKARITACNYDDHASRLGECDWIVEVVAERLDIKRKVYSWVAANRREGSIVSSNTSGIPLKQLTAEMPPEMREHFLVTHFFNPVRYMRLLELVAGPETNPEILETVAEFGERVLGKGVVWAKDTPNFVANRVGTYGMASVFRHVARTGLTVEAVDAIFGPAMGRPKSAVFRTADLVGLDTLGHVFQTLHTLLPDDDQRDAFVLPDYVTRLLANGNLGEKTGAGFYKKVKNAEGKSEILALDLATGAYRSQTKPRYDSIGKARKADTLGEKLQALISGTDEAAVAAWTVLADTLLYAAGRIPEVADDVVNVDNAMRWGFAWDLGPFETWDALGVQASVARMKTEGRPIPDWVEAMLLAGRTSFYARDVLGRQTAWGPSGEAAVIPAHPGRVLLVDVKAREQSIVHRSPNASLVDLGEGVLGLEFHSKLNSLDELLFDAYEKALDKLDAGEFEALVVGNQDARAFCAGANVLMILMGAMQGAWKEMDASVLRLQRLLMRAKYHRRPVVTAPFGLTLGGGAEVAMHSAATQAGGELYMGLVEVGVGLIPAGGGCKEMVVRYLGDVPQDIAYDPNPFVQKAFERIGLAKISTSAEEARGFGFLRPTDRISLNPDRLLGDARSLAAGLVRAGYAPPRMRTVKVPGPSGRAAIELFLYQMREGGYATEHDVTVGKKLANVLCGGDVPNGTVRTEWDLLDLEREAFLSLAGEPKSQARMQHML
ncbi:MAG: 3-hydroxyacyl-CoA dehydrogenase/enoyl-CoA hydratase family protein, partial [Deltaproteobacteria bacterium]|nr:3-hydroxyacyl-CoA dehydrogenase/enoyl-CoA hydratase family protein [Deltaproteobacteria bacterium]